jgi:MFS family permease
VSADGHRQHYGLTLGVLVIGALAYALSQTLVAPALPEIQRVLHTSTSTVTFVLTAYLLTASVATPIVGRLGDMFGKERMLVATLLVFGAGSLVAALSHSIGMLIAGARSRASAARSSRSRSGSSVTSSRPSGWRRGSG